MCVDLAEGGVRGDPYLTEGGEGALGHGLVLDPPENPLAVVQFRAVGRQIVQMDVLSCQLRGGRLDLPAAVDGGVVQDYHARAVAGAGPGVAQEVDEVLGTLGEGSRPLGQGRPDLRAGGRQDRQRVHAPAPGVLVGDDRSHAGPGPGVGGGQGRAEAGLVQEKEIKGASHSVFLKSASWTRAAAACSGSCRWRRVACVRRQRAPMPCRYLRTVRGFRWIPSSARATARVAELQTCRRCSSRSRAASITCRRARLGRTPRGCSRTAAMPSAAKRCSRVRTVVWQQARWSARAGTFSPRLESSRHSTRSRSRVRSVGSRRRAWSSRRWAGVSEACRGADMAGGTVKERDFTIAKTNELSMLDA